MIPYSLKEKKSAERNFSCSAEFWGFQDYHSYSFTLYAVSTIWIWAARKFTFWFQATDRISEVVVPP